MSYDGTGWCPKCVIEWIHLLTSPSWHYHDPPSTCHSLRWHASVHPHTIPPHPQQCHPHPHPFHIIHANPIHTSFPTCLVSLSLPSQDLHMGGDDLPAVVPGPPVLPRRDPISPSLGWGSKLPSWPGGGVGVRMAQHVVLRTCWTEKRWTKSEKRSYHGRLRTRRSNTTRRHAIDRIVDRIR